MNHQVSVNIILCQREIQYSSYFVEQTEPESQSQIQIQIQTQQIQIQIQIKQTPAQTTADISTGTQSISDEKYNTLKTIEIDTFSTMEYTEENVDNLFAADS